MDSQEFVVKSLTALKAKYNDVTLKYQYDKSLDDHLVLISPDSYYEENEPFVIDTNNIWFEFVKLSFSGNLLFLCSKSIVKLEANLDTIIIGNKL